MRSQECLRLIDSWAPHSNSAVRAPGGAIRVRYQQYSNEGGDQRIPLTASLLDSKGLAFYYERLIDRPHPKVDTTLGLEHCITFVHNHFRNAQAFFQDSRVERPGYLKLAIGLENVAKENGRNHGWVSAARARIR